MKGYIYSEHILVGILVLHPNPITGISTMFQTSFLSNCLQLFPKIYLQVNQQTVKYAVLSVGGRF